MRTSAVFFIAVLIFTVFAAAAAAENLLVLTDGSAITVEDMTMRGGRVEVRLPGSVQPVAYAVGDVDLEASGLAPEKVPTSFATPQKQIRGGFEAAIAPPSGENEVVMISDQDVEHVRPGLGDDEGEAETPPASRAPSLLVSNLQREVTPDGMLTVKGTVTNSGTVPVTAIAITGEAQDDSGAPLGRGTTGISSTIAAGEAAAFSITFPVSGTVANIKVTAAAAISDFTFEPVPAPQEDDEEDYGDDFADAPDEANEDGFEE